MTGAVEAGPGTVLCVGRLYADLVLTGLDGFPALGREVYARELALVPGGGAFITAAHLVALGCPAALVARLGTDALADAIAPSVAAAGIELRWLERAADAGPQVTVAMTHQDDRAFLTRRAGTAAPVSLAEALAHEAVRHVHVGELATLREIPDLPARARAHGLTLSLDCSWDTAALVDPAALALLAGIDLFLPNEAEALAVTQAADLPTALSALRRLVPLVVVKRGAAGAVLARGGHLLELRAPAVRVRDTTGAGDAFDAGFLASWLGGGSDREALAHGLAAGSLAVQRIGGADPPVCAQELVPLAAAILEGAGACEAAR